MPELHLVTQQLVDTLLQIDDRRSKALLTDILSGERDDHIPLETVVVPALEWIGKALYEILAPHNPDMQVVCMSGNTENVIA